MSTMIVNDRPLPMGFEDLEPFVAEWALPLNMARYTKRVNSTMDELNSFYAAIEPRAEEALRLLDTYSIAEIEGPEARLMHLLLMLIDVSLAVEVYRMPALPLSPAPQRYAVTMDNMFFN
ncbi:hypothetical protein D3Y57_02070 (plasmid) [Sphingomonas paeninsulae]|uniref:Xaa-Pro dipeptidase n=1 Tax=Sphingomonas paeninsulae TaxID=2319844 RepID=A0A494T7L9_SPHPE|nr:hypothetical protein [Sphingomonas paeninsulae]AYJ84880.1 hypothetical protein D3Y57_02070 [Sphingomonas paeninsulae]